MCISFSGRRFWWELWIFKRAVHNEFLNHCSWMLLICRCGSVFSHSSHSLAPVGYVWWGNSHSLILLPLVQPGSKDCFKPHGWGYLGCPQIPLEVTWNSTSQSWKVHSQRGVEFWLGCRYFPAWDVLFTHLYNREVVEKGWVEWPLLFLYLFGKIHWCHSGWHCLTNTAWVMGLLR